MSLSPGPASIDCPEFFDWMRSTEDFFDGETYRGAEYAKLLIDSGFRTWRSICAMEMEDLREMKLGTIGHRRLLLTEIRRCQRADESIINILPTSESEMKIVFLGRSNVGKTSIFHRFLGAHHQRRDATLQMDMRTTHKTVKNQIITVRVWDTAGTERFDSLTTTSMRGAVGFVLVEAFDSYEYANSLNRYLELSQEHGILGSKYVLLLNKDDLYNETEEGRKRKKNILEDIGRWASGNRIPLFVTSAVTGSQIHKAMDSLIENIAVDDSLRYYTESMRQNSVRLANKEKQEKTGLLQKRTKRKRGKREKRCAC